MTKDLPSPVLLRKLLRYEPETGNLFWRERVPDMFHNGARWTASQSCKRWNTRYAWKEAFTAIDARGYAIGAVKNKLLSKHRVCWAIYYGVWPLAQIDHQNGDRADNRINNLKSATNRENSMNTGKKKNNTTGYCGVSHNKDKFRAQIKIHGRQLFLGCFKTAEEAHVAYLEAKATFGFSDRHGTSREP